MRNQFLRSFFSPVDIASFVFFRFCFGTFLFLDICKKITLNHLHFRYIEPQFYFRYYGFDWIPIWPDWGIVLHFVVMGVLAAFIALGWWYRASLGSFLLLWLYAFLIDQSNYLNHGYLILLLCFLMLFVQTPHDFSLDQRRHPEQSSPTTPAWTLWILKIQIAVVYFYGGIAKLNMDWFQGQPMRILLKLQTQTKDLNPIFMEEWMVWFISYGGLFFDLLVVPFFLWKRTRVFAVVLAVFFHLSNAVIFRIGVFPWIMIPATLLFLDPSWPRKAKGLFSFIGPAPGKLARSLHYQFKLRNALVMAGFALEVVLPTPPLPEVTTIMRAIEIPC